MASPAEMLSCLADGDLRDTVTAALWAVANDIRERKESKRFGFARAVFVTPDLVHQPVMRAVVAQFADLTASQIKKLPADAVKDAVEAVVDLFAESFA